MERGRWDLLEKTLKEYPALQNSIDLAACARGDGPALERLKNHLIHLAKEDILQDIRDLKEEEDELEEKVIMARKEGIGRKLKKLKPGGSSSLKAVQKPDMSIATDQVEIAAELARHWGEVFKKRGIDTKGLEEWIKRVAHTWDKDPLPTNPTRWKVKRKHIQKALRCSRLTAPGPDGLSAFHWKKLGKVAVDALYEAARELEDGDAEDIIQDAYWDMVGPDDPHNFNLGVLCCIPKKPVGQHETLGEVYDGDSTRPLMIVNVANRIIAAAYKICWEDILAPWISQQQRGFLPGRSMLANVVELEHEAMVASLQHEQGLLLLLDFKAAFPSVSHEYLLGCLKGYGMPASARRVVEALYNKGGCLISSSGRLLPGFRIRAGIRQGCPLSPLIFAAAMDLFLRMLRERLGEQVTVRAFADDVGLVLTDLKSQLPILKETLREFGAISGMMLNLPKTTGVPLWPCELQEAKRIVKEVVPEWQDLPLARTATYLGCAIGPGKGEVAWNTPAKRYIKRIKEWNWGELGLQFAAAAYNTYALPIFSFAAQLVPPGAKVLELEEWGLRQAAPGPGNWMYKEDLWSLSKHGMLADFGSLGPMAQAAKLRVAAYENAHSGGLGLEGLAKQLATAKEDAVCFNRILKFTHWYNQAFHTCLLNNIRFLEKEGIKTSRIHRNLANNEPAPLPYNIYKSAKRNFQRTAKAQIITCKRKALHEDGGWYEPEERARHNIKRWTEQIPAPLNDPLGRLAYRFSSRRHRLRGLVPPRVMAASFSTAWNRWCTHRRFQKRDSPGNVCCLGCGGGAEDSLEHYCRCPTVRTFHAKCLRIQAYPLLSTWMGIQEGPQDDATFALGLIGAYATYVTTNTAHHGARMSPEEAMRALQQAAKEAVSGHVAATGFLTNVWKKN